MKRVLEAVRNSDIEIIAACRKTLCSQSYPEKTFRQAELYCCGKHSRIGNVEIFPLHVEDPQSEQRYTSTPSLTSALDGLGGQRHVPAALHTEKTRYSLYKMLGRPHGRSVRLRNISPHRVSIPGPSSPQRVAVRTELSRHGRGIT